VHAGIVVLLVGVAASSTFQHSRDVRLAPGESARVGGYDIKYVRPTSKLDITRSGSLEKIDLGADLRVSRGHDKPIPLHAERSYFPSSDPQFGAVSRYFEGESTSEVGLRTTLRRDIWTTVLPDLGRLQKAIRGGDKVFAAAKALPARERSAALGEALRRLAADYPKTAPPATFRILISPLVTWIWLGALIVFIGGLTALWPAPSGVARRVTAANAARIARGLGRSWRQEA